jgi:hypothetical protein
MTRTITALFDARSDATHAVDRLISEGINRGAIQIVPERDPVTPGHAGYDQARPKHKNFWETLGSFLMPDEDRYSYAEALHRGSVMVSATVKDSLAGKVSSILEEYDGAVDMDARVAQWKQEGWSGWQGDDRGVAQRQGTDHGPSRMAAPRWSKVRSYESDSEVEDDTR